MILLISISGCLNADLNTKLNKDFSGTKTMHLEMAPILYSALESNLSRENMSQIPGAEIVSYKKGLKNNMVILDIIVNYKDLRNVSNINISEKDNILRFEDSSFGKLETVNESNFMSGVISINYSVEMPYKIDNSNADNIEGNKANWVIVGLTPRTLYAESKVPAIPGFTTITLLIASLFLVIILRKQNK